MGGEDECRVPNAGFLSTTVVLCVIYSLPSTPLLVCVLIFKCSANDSQVPFRYNWNNGMIRKTQVKSSLSLDIEIFDSDV